MGAVDERFVATLIQATKLFGCDGMYGYGQDIQLDGRGGTITVACGNEMSSFSGFKFPWSQTISIKASDAFASLALSSSDQLICGVLDRSFVMAAGPWRLRLPLTTPERPTNIDAGKRSLGPVSNRIQLDPEDLKFVLGHLKPCTRSLFIPQFISLELNDRVVVVIEEANRPGTKPPPKRLVMSRSTNKGKPTLLNIVPSDLRQVAQLGLTKLQWHSGSQRLSHSNERLLYISKASSGVNSFPLPYAVTEIESASGSPVLA